MLVPWQTCFWRNDWSRRFTPERTIRWGNGAISLEYQFSPVALVSLSYDVKGDFSMKFVKLFAISALISAMATASFAGSCCSKKKDGAQKDKAEQKDAPKQAPQS
jgi:hypothetical protein